jgi:hypothetical protein
MVMKCNLSLCLARNLGARLKWKCKWPVRPATIVYIAKIIEGANELSSKSLGGTMCNVVGDRGK